MSFLEFLCFLCILRKPKGTVLLAIVATTSYKGDDRLSNPGPPRLRHMLFQLVRGLTTSAESVISLLSFRHRLLQGYTHHVWVVPYLVGLKKKQRRTGGQLGGQSPAAWDGVYWAPVVFAFWMIWLFMRLMHRQQRGGFCWGGGSWRPCLLLPLSTLYFLFIAPASSTREQGTKFCIPSGCQRASQRGGLYSS